jgi:DNA repair exonuclease SbcCD ATPase subunit
MSEILFQGEAESGTTQENEAGTVALSVDDFAALEERVLRAVELVKRERQAKTEAEGRAAGAEAQLSEQGAHLERLERDVKQLRAERDHVRQRVEKLLKQLDSLEL